MIITRTWAMPSPDTFGIKPIGEFVKKYLYGVSIDPFARNRDWFTHTNDINPETAAMYHMDAREFLREMVAENVKADVLIFDPPPPPYSPRQISECYKGFGKAVGMKDTQLSGLLCECKDIAKQLDPEIVLTFGWNSCGMGKTRGYKIAEILLVSHGGGHNDTICTAEIKEVI